MSEDRGLAFEARVLPKERMYLVCGGCKVRRRVRSVGKCENRKESFDNAIYFNDFTMRKGFSAASRQNTAVQVLAPRHSLPCNRMGDAQETRMEWAMECEGAVGGITIWKRRKGGERPFRARLIKTGGGLPPTRRRSDLN